MMSNQNISANINQPNVSNVVQNVPSAPIVSAGPNVSVPNVNVSNVSVSNISGQTQMNSMNQINPMINMQHMARNQPANVLYQGSKLFSTGHIIFSQIDFMQIFNHFSSESNAKSTFLQKESKPISSVTDGKQFTKSNGTESTSSITASNKYYVAKNW